MLYISITYHTCLLALQLCVLRPCWGTLQWPCYGCSGTVPDFVCFLFLWWRMMMMMMMMMMMYSFISSPIIMWYLLHRNDDVFPCFLFPLDILQMNCFQWTVTQFTCLLLSVCNQHNDDGFSCFQWRGRLNLTTFLLLDCFAFPGVETWAIDDYLSHEKD